MTATIERPVDSTGIQKAVEVKAVNVMNALTACLLSAAKSGELTVLQSVLVVKEGDTLTFTGTDRYRLTRARVKILASDHPDFRFLLTREDAARIVAALKPLVKTNPSLELFVASNRLLVNICGSQLSFLPQGEEYPRTDSIGQLPKERLGTTRIAFNPSFMADLCKMPGRVRNEGMVLEVTDAFKPVTCSWGDDDVAYEHVLMPVRMAP